MAQSATDVKAALDKKGQKEVAEQQGSSIIKYSNLAYVQEEDANKVTKNKLLGKGGCGTVYLGTYRQVEGFVAIKELFINSASDEVTKEFENEAQIMGKLRSDYLVQFYGCCLSPKYCLVMEYMPEGSLYNLLHNKKPLDWVIRYQISINMSLGLEFLHEQSILHQDIKSLNVLLKNGRAKLSDFGLSRIKKESNSTQGGSVGTVQWMAPELFERRPKYTQKSDIYSLGMTFWEIASRQIPFADATNNAMISAWVGQGERETIPEDCPKKFSSLIYACWKGEGAKADKLWKGQASDRPTAKQITDYLRSKEEDFEAFIAPKSIASQSEYLGNLDSQPNFVGNLASGAVGSAALDIKTVRDNPPQLKPAIPPKPPIPAKPAVVPPPLLYTPQYQVQAVIPAAQATKVTLPPVDTKQLQEFLNHVAWGRQDEAEAMLKANKELALASGNVTDHAKRTFNNITGFQLAVWNLDWKMWSMILPYLPKDAAIEQAKGFKTGPWVKEQGEHATWKKLTDALQVYIDKSGWSQSQCKKHWVDEVGNGGQLPSPMHVLQEYCNPGRPFEPCPDFSTQYTLQRTLPVWLSSAIRKGKFDFGVLRHNFSTEWEASAARLPGAPATLVDRSALISLYNTRAQQRGELVSSILGSVLSVAQKANWK